MLAVEISGEDIANSDVIQNWKHAKSLELEGLRKLDFSDLASLSELSHLVIRDTPVLLRNAIGADQLIRLEIHNGGEFDLRYLTRCKSLSHFHVSNTRLKSIDAIARWKLKELTLKETGLTSLDFFDRATAIESIDISQNPIQSLEGVHLHPALDTINLNGTQVADLNPLKRLPNLRRVAINNTNVSDLGPLSELKGRGLLALHARNTIASDVVLKGSMRNLSVVDVGHSDAFEHRMNESSEQECVTNNYEWAHDFGVSLKKYAEPAGNRMGIERATSNQHECAH